MIKPLSIERRDAAADPLGFDSLRREAIELLQQVSGERWTDYNLHDPGVTILEQLVFALTELIYRADFPVRDYLDIADGRVDLDAQNLQEPAAILSCRATTAQDYRKLMLSAIAELDNVWLASRPARAGEATCGGLYRLRAKLVQGLDSERRADVIDRLRRCYAESRNLCEDLDAADICVVENVAYELCAEIEVNSAWRPAETLARIYFDCARRMASGVSFAPYQQQPGQELPLDQLFEGPHTSHGFFIDRDAGEQRDEFLVSSLFDTINGLDEVDRIGQLCLARGDRQFYVRIKAEISEQAFDLHLPRAEHEVRVHLTNKGRRLPVAIDELVARIDELGFKYQLSRRTPRDLSALYQPIEGEARPLARYASVQNQFPASYGVNRHGVPQSAGVDVKGRARQLKAYLLIFEQLMANYLANVGNLGVLFSSRHGDHRSYREQAIEPSQVHDLHAVYPPDAAARLSEIGEDLDDYNDRKSRLLDYLLALYGERFTQHSLRHFGYYYGRNEVEGVIVNNKIALLASIVALGRDRAAAADLGAGPGRSGLEIRAAMLLGFELRAGLSLGGAIDGQGFTLCPHDDYVAASRNTDGWQPVDLESLDDGAYRDVEQTPLAPVDDSDLDALRRGLGAVAPLAGELLSQRLLIDGISIQSYRVLVPAPGGRFALALRLDASLGWRLGEFDSREAAVGAANRLRQYLLGLNRDSEGLRLVEHLLLRPSGGLPAKAADDAEEFYSFRFSVILPAWTRRCGEPAFRNLVEETLRLNAPAHLFGEVHWLDFDAMLEFERLHDDWIELRAVPGAPASQLDALSAGLVDFLRARRPGSAA